MNRIDEVIVFHSLHMEEMYSIVDLLLNRVRIQLTEQQVELVVPQVAKDFLIDKGFDPQYGARPLRRRPLPYQPSPRRALITLLPLTNKLVTS